jgi:hypothetical protein
MPIKHTIKADNNLEKALGNTLNNQKMSFDIEGVITLKYEFEKGNKTTIVELYLKSKYAKFNGDFTQTAHIDPGLKSLVDYLDKENWTTNLE